MAVRGAPLAVSERSRWPGRLLLAAWVAVGAAAGALFARSGYDVQGALLVAPALLLVALLLARRAASAGGAEGGFLAGVVVTAFVLKMGAALGRLVVSFEVYGAPDASGYHGSGVALARLLRDLRFEAAAPFLEWGTPMTKLLTGAVYAVIGPTLHGGYLVFGLLAFLGSWCFYRAFRTALPQGSYRLYAVLVFLFPSLLYWPNGLGKDALMLLSLGLGAYGAARLLHRPGPGGALALAAGLAGALVVRPHMAAILAVAAGLAVLPALRPSRTPPLVVAAGLAAAGVLSWLLVTRALDYVGLETLELEATLDYIALRQGQTLEGGSAFQPPRLTEALGVPGAFATILFRPYPWEAHNLQALLQGLDGVLLLVLMVWRVGSLGWALRAAPRTPYLLLALAYVVMTTIAFTTIANFGTLARERAMLLPFVFVLLAAAPSRREAPAARRRAVAEGVRG